ncbi:uncharacterized protein LOC108905317 [Anoplophora glabripennis]|uniref:uncharacterized protein LOC108905317 n=1 Tax=Anoplophora glabripennis TaxID=217634 RepID=UPI0008757FE7|nr:uncharacterized protein LOC108905317 [Anoplophora glabripennis]
MNFIVLVNLLFLLGLSQAQFRSSEETDPARPLRSEESPQRYQRKEKVLKRVARNEFRNLAQKYVPALEKIIIDNCKANGQYDAAEKLQPTFEEMKTCLSKKKLLVTPREELLALIEECIVEPVKQSKNCLAETQRYYPQLLSELAKSLTNFLYDDYDIIRVDLIACFPKLNNVKVATSYEQCLREVAIRTHDSREIPHTKTEFCQVFVPTAYCFTNMVKENCNRTQGLAKFREDYVKLHKNICEEK